jgi:molybdopterin converting factor small subunit
MRVHVSTVGLPIGDENPEKQSMGQEQERSIPMDLPGEATVGDLLRQLGDQGKQVQKVLLNGAEADDQTDLKDGDYVALVGQVSGI